MAISRTFACLLFGLCGLLAAAGCGRHEPVAYSLVYEIDPDDAADRDEIDMADFVKRIDRRVNVIPTGEVRLTDNGQFQVDLYGKNPQTIAEVKGRLSQSGMLSFRIVATQHDHPELIARAIAMPLNEHKLYNQEDATHAKLLAQWIPMASSQTSNFDGSPEYGLRKLDDGEFEILVVMDIYNVNGTHLQKAAATIDSQTSTPAVAFAFNEQGGNLFGALTGTNLPDYSNGFHRQLAIILDDRLQSAPRIVSSIYNNGQITGVFTQQEADDLAAILMAGPFPARLKLVSEKAVEPTSGKVEK